MQISTVDTFTGSLTDPKIYTPALSELPKLTEAEGVDLSALLTEACQDVEDIDAATFRALLSPVDVEDIEGGIIPMLTLNAYARSFAEGIRRSRITVLADRHSKNHAALARALWRVPALRAGHHR